MGSILSMVYYWWSASPKVAIESYEEYSDLGSESDVPDATTGLTLRHVTAMNRTWDLLRPDIKTHGINVFINLFKEEPLTQTKFKGFSNMTENQLRSSRRLAAHGSTVMHALSMMVENLDDVSTLAELLKTTGENHYKRGIPKGDFDLFVPVFLKFLKNSLGDAYTPLAEEGWTQGLKVINTVIQSTYETAPYS